MAFPTSPVDGQLYTTSLGTEYRYTLADTAWKIVGGSGGGSGHVLGTVDTIAMFTPDTTSVGDSIITQSGSSVTVAGDINFGSDVCLMSTKGAWGSNIFIGGGGQSDTTGARNTAVGKNTLRDITIGSDNVCIGDQAGLAITTGARNTFIGGQAGVSGFTGLANCISIGYGSVIVDQSNTTVIGNGDTTKAVIYGDLGIDNTSPLGIIHPISSTQMAGNVGPTDATVGTFTRDTTSPAYTREDHGWLTDDGKLRIVGTDSTITKFIGCGFVYTETDEPTVESAYAGFKFNHNTVSLDPNSNGIFATSSVDGSFCIIADILSHYLELENKLGSTKKMGYWVKYWEKPHA
jgi:hypothetical protein